jgi:glycerophosphoryl diester phosphodiesterase
MTTKPTTRPMVLGHRGAPRRARENTLEAFAAAASIGADGVETDVRRTADGVCVLHHDPAVDDFGLISEHPFAELRELRPEVPTLDEALDALGDLFVNLELKCLPWEPDADPDGIVARTVAAAVLGRRLTDRVVVSSFDLGVLGVVRSIDTRIPLGWLTFGQTIDHGVGAAVERGLAWVHPDCAMVMEDPEGAVRAAHDRGLKIDVWTVNDPADQRALAAAGVDALITDAPDEAIAALTAPS